MEKMTFREIFIRNMKSLRKKNGFSQERLAEICDSSQVYIAEIETGKKFPSPDMIERIAAALEIESYCLFQKKAETGERLLSPEQQKAIVNSINASVSKIISEY